VRVCECEGGFCGGGSKIREGRRFRLYKNKNKNKNKRLLLLSSNVVYILD
jgi:hypothetical protein